MGRRKIITRLFFVATIVAGIMFFLFSGRASGTHFWFFDIGQGDATLLQWGEWEMLVDGGPDVRVVEKLGSAMSLWDRRVDLVVLTHPDADHLLGLPEVLRRYEVGRFLTSGWAKASPDVLALEQRVWNQRIPTIVHSQTAQTLDLPNGWKAVLPSLPTDARDDNDRSVVVWLTNGQLRVLLMGDASVNVEALLLKQYPELFPVDILKLGHHGSCTSSSFEFLKAAAPKMAMISAGKDNRYGHPCKAVLQRLRELGIQPIRTDQMGDLRVDVQNGEFILRAERSIVANVNPKTR